MSVSVCVITHKQTHTMRRRQFGRANQKAKIQQQPQEEIFSRQ